MFVLVRDFLRSVRSLRSSKPANSSMIGIPTPSPTPRPIFAPGDVAPFALTDCEGAAAVLVEVVVEDVVVAAEEDWVPGTSAASAEMLK